MDRSPPLGGLLFSSAVVGVLLALASGYALGSATLPVILFAAVVVMTGCGVVHSYPHPALGLCNVVTLARAALVTFLAGVLFATGVSAWIVFGVSTVAFALDGVDGWLARRSGLTSDFGARFDMETDAGLAAILSLWLMLSGTTGPEILVLGFMRYAFVLASVVWPALRADLPVSFRRKAICVVQIAALVVLIFPPTPEAVLLPIAAVAAVLLTWSFLVDIIWLTRRAG